MTDLELFPDLNIQWTTSEEMNAVDDGSVQSVITSPPYWNLKDYGHKKQIGTADESYEVYHNRLQTVWSECYDKLRNDGTMWVVVDAVMEQGDMQLLPLHMAERARSEGFRVQDFIVWHKPTAIAGMTERNVVNKKEYIIYLSKSEKRKFRTGVRDENSTEDPAITDSQRLGDLWRYPVKRGTAGQTVLHKAPYPIALIDRIIKLSTETRDTVLDPFLGSGTTAYASLDLDRKCVGYEINKEFENTIRQRLSALQQSTLSEY